MVILYLILLLFASCGLSGAQNSVEATITKTNMAASMQSEAILVANAATIRFEKWNDRRLHIERHFDSVYGKKWTCVTGKSDSFSSTIPETEASFIAFKLQDLDVILSRGNLPDRLEQAQKDLKMANEKVNQLTADLTEARDQLNVFLHQEKVKKRRSADQSPVIHSTTWIGQWMLQDRVFAAAKEAVAMTPDLELIANQILKPLNDPNSSFQWFCKVSDRDPDGRVYIPPSANHIIFSIQGITVHLSYRSKQSPSDILVSS